jgi:transcriptional regulator with XRE-family HTH domain
MDATRLGSVIRAVRVRLRLRQLDVARRAGVARSTISRIERGVAGSLPLDDLLRVTSSLEISVDLVPRWRGGELTRMLNAGHATMHEAVARLLAAWPEWTFAPEVSFAVYGERGVIDVLAYHTACRTLLVIELKTELVDVQGLLGSADGYRRLALGIARERGWNAAHVSVWVILRDTDTSRRRVAAHATVLRSALHSTAGLCADGCEPPTSRWPGSHFSQMVACGALTGWLPGFGASVGIDEGEPSTIPRHIRARWARTTRECSVDVHLRKSGPRRPYRGQAGPAPRP